MTLGQLEADIRLKIIFPVNGNIHFDFMNGNFSLYHIVLIFVEFDVPEKAIKYLLCITTGFASTVVEK